MDRLDNILNQLKEVESEFNSELKRVENESYKQGYKDGLNKGFQISEAEDPCLQDIDFQSIKVFAEFCYINGIDFSYMAKGTDTLPFTEKVINKFKYELESKESKANIRG